MNNYIMFILNLTCASILMCYVNTIKVNTCVYFMFAWQLDRISTATILAEILRRSSYQQKQCMSLPNNTEIKVPMYQQHSVCPFQLIQRLKEPHLEMTWLKVLAAWQHWISQKLALYLSIPLVCMYTNMLAWGPKTLWWYIHVHVGRVLCLEYRVSWAHFF